MQHEICHKQNIKGLIKVEGTNRWVSGYFHPLPSANENIFSILSPDTITKVMLSSVSSYRLSDEGITVTLAEPSDAGIYICIAQNNAGTALGQVQLEMQGLWDKSTALGQLRLEMQVSNMLMRQKLRQHEKNVAFCHPFYIILSKKYRYCIQTEQKTKHRTFYYIIIQCFQAFGSVDINTVMILISELMTLPSLRV